jgi:hypothetical protein
MFKDILKQLPITTLILIYLYICGGLYLIAFWSTFKIDISNIVSVTEIPKSFIFPFLLSNSFLLFSILYELILPTVTEPKPIVINGNSLVKRVTSAEGLLALVIALVFTISIFIEIGKFTLAAIAIGFFLIHKMLKSEYIKSIITYYPLRRYLVITFISTPILSYSLGANRSYQIYNNVDPQIVKSPTKNSIIEFYSTNDSTKLKLLGFLGDKVIISTIDNKRTFILNQSAVEKIEIEQKVKP